MQVLASVKLLEIVASKFDNKKLKKQKSAKEEESKEERTPDIIFAKLQEIKQLGTTSTENRMVIINLMETREKGWPDKKKNEGPMTLAQLQ